MEVVRLVFRALLVTLALGLIVAWLVPGGDRYVDVATAVMAAATWLAPLAGLAWRWNRWPKASLAIVGVWISILAYAAILSVMTMALAVIDFIFAGGGEWAWRSLLAVVA